MNILFYQKLNREWMREIKKLESEFPDSTFICETDKAGEYVAEADILVGGRLPADLFKSAENLKLVVVPIAGVNHLPFDIIRGRGIRVANSHGNARYVAERAVAMILAFYGRIIEYHNDLAEGRWHGFWVGRGLDDTWESIYGKRCGILGAGEIGKYIASFLQPFGVTSTGFRRKKSGTLPPGFDRIVYSPEEAIDDSEIVVIALPSTEETRGMIDKKMISSMKGKLLVNIGRGEIADEKALYEALEDGTLKGAAIDCWYNYPDSGTEGKPSAYPVHDLPNIVLSPHVAGFTQQAAELNIIQACDNIRAFLKSEDLIFEVDTEKGY